MLTSLNPTTGEAAATGLEPTDAASLEALASSAEAAAAALAESDLSWRAELLESMASVLEERRELLVGTAGLETGLGEARLNGELSRTTFQLRLFAEAVREGSFLEVAIDHARTTPLGPGPDIRRMLVPVGPVAVFGSSNFPFAFSVPGGDTASALAAGNPVIVKAHSAHLLTSRHAYEALLAGAAKVSAPEGTLGIVYGQSAGASLVAHPAIRAVGFTGSLGAAQRLQEIINARVSPVPLYGELQSLNPLIVTEGALVERGAGIAEGLAASVTGSGGQLCTKPGLAFVPDGAAGDLFVASLRDLVQQQTPHVLLGGRVHENFERVRDRLRQTDGITEVAQGEETGAGYAAAPTVLSVAVDDFAVEHTEEAFGPLIVLVRYNNATGIEKALRIVPGSLTATVHFAAGELELAARLAKMVQPLAGRVLFGGFPTGVRVSWAQHHGGPWPSTNSLHSSVGVTAMRRFLRPLVWQDAPEELLPAVLRDGFRQIPRRIDGELQLAEGR